MPKVSIVVVMAMRLLSVSWLSTRNQMAMSNRPKPTTVRPITAPERKAIFKPPSRLLRAALAVRALAYVAVFIPKKPARPLKKPPVRKANGTHGF